MLRHYLCYFWYIGLQNITFSPCLQSQNLAEEGLEKDLYIQGTTVTVLAADLKRCMDIKKLVYSARLFLFVF